MILTDETGRKNTQKARKSLQRKHCLKTFFPATGRPGFKGSFGCGPSKPLQRHLQRTLQRPLHPVLLPCRTSKILGKEGKDAQKNKEIQGGTNVHFSNVHFVLCQIFGLKPLTPPFHAFFPPPPLYCFLTK